MKATHKTSGEVATAAPRLRLRVTATAETILRGGHPWLFADSIREQNRAGESGELAVIFDRKDSFLAVGLFDPGSPIRVRILHSGKPVAIDEAWWQSRLETAVAKREALFSPAEDMTTGFRLINGESDGWPALVMDRYDTTLVVKIYSAAWLPRLDQLLPLFRARLLPERIVLRLSRNIQDTAGKLFKKTDGQILFGPALAEPVVFVENGLRFEAEVLRGQKTGFFLDQRENRKFVETLARGRAVLNAFSFSGGFSLYAARGGASSVADLDISAHALESARRNFALNETITAVASCPHEFIQADTFEWLEKSGERKFDLIVLDPPSLAKRETERAGAVHAYERLAGLGIRSLKLDGILVAASCSAHVTAAEFFGAVKQAVTKSGRKFTELRTSGHAADHHATFSEGEYLKAIFIKLY